MIEGRVPPLRNTPAQGRAHTLLNNNLVTPDSNNSNKAGETDGIQRGVVGGNKGKPQSPGLVYALCLCPRCGGYNQLAYRYGRMPETAKCLVCGEILPTDSYLVKSYGNVALSPEYVAKLENQRKGGGR